MSRRDYRRSLLLDYRYIADAQDHYERLNYEPVEAPWVIDESAYEITLPDGVARYETLGGFLVGSAEQSFCQMLMDGDDLQRVQAVTPCFRDESHDELHSPYFLKLELFDSTKPMTAESVLEVAADAVAFFNRYLEVELVQEGETSWDIVGKKTGIELGSYGIRSFDEHSWIYGTGVALPRLQQVVEKELAA